MRYGTKLGEMQQTMLASIVDDPDRQAEVKGRFLAGNAPHPFDQVAMWSLQQRLCGLPEVAVTRARKAIERGADQDRYTGIMASSVAGDAMFGGGGSYTFTVYAAQFGDWVAQLGVIRGDSYTGGYDRINQGRWVRVDPVGKHRDRDWALVWIDGMYSHLTGIGHGRTVRGLAIDARTVPIVFRINAHSGGRLVGTAGVQSLPHRMHDYAEEVREHFAELGYDDVIVTYHPA